MNNAYIYSYRLTHFGGTAPCYDGDYLSLAICKRDMRRVIGYRFNEIKIKLKTIQYGLSGFQERSCRKIINILRLTE